MIPGEAVCEGVEGEDKGTGGLGPDAGVGFADFDELLPATGVLLWTLDPTFDGMGFR